MTSLRPFALLEFSGNFFSIGQFKIVILFSCGKSRACPYIVFIVGRLFRCKNSSLENKFEFPFSSATSLSFSSLIISRINSCSKCGAKIIQLLASLN
ncbi:hypothetical protein E1A91_A01G020100v1 [Gossypium mustelinum]|uniref:Uncharacterized protein n=1 Tax=Gossypium mustelinum TaxID=34275 RepID=A0A5D3AEA9_GOSMU|nr:hypothetical protein E1A91_A01G020100v1 [Gossypium mustelinum]